MSSSPRSTSRRSTRPRSTRSTSAPTTKAASSSCACGPTAPTSSAATRRRPIPVDLAPDELTPEHGRELLAQGAGGPRELGDRSRDRPHRARAHRSLRPVRAARRAGRRASKEKPKRASLFASMDPTTVTLERGARAPVAAARRRCSTPTATRSPRRTVATGPYLKKGTDSRSLGVGGPAVHGDARGGRGDLRPAEAAARPGRRSRRSPSSARTPSRARRCACSTAGSVRTSPTARMNATVPRGVRARGRHARAGGRAAARAGGARRRPRRGREEEGAEATTKKATAKKATAKQSTAKKAHGAKKADGEEGASASEADQEGERAPADARYVAPRMPEEQPAEREAPFIPSDADEPPIPPRRGGSSARKSFFRLWLAQVVSSLGDWIGLIAILAIAARVSDNSGAAVSLVMTTRVAARVPPRHRRRRDHRPLRPPQGDGALRRRSRRACSCCCRSSRTCSACVLISLGLEILTLLWGPAQAASVPNLVPEEQLSSANSLSLAASLRHVPDRVDHLLAARRARGGARRPRHHLRRSRSTRRCSRSSSTR